MKRMSRKQIFCLISRTLGSSKLVIIIIIIKNVIGLLKRAGRAEEEGGDRPSPRTGWCQTAHRPNLQRRTTWVQGSWPCSALKSNATVHNVRLLNLNVLAATMPSLSTSALSVHLTTAQSNVTPDITVGLAKRTSRGGRWRPSSRVIRSGIGRRYRRCRRSSGRFRGQATRKLKVSLGLSNHFPI